jgi:hypothetical protein
MVARVTTPWPGTSPATRSTGRARSPPRRSRGAGDRRRAWTRRSRHQRRRGGGKPRPTAALPLGPPPAPLGLLGSRTLRAGASSDSGGRACLVIRGPYGLGVRGRQWLARQPRRRTGGAVDPPKGQPATGLTVRAARRRAGPPVWVAATARAPVFRDDLRTAWAAVDLQGGAGEVQIHGVLLWSQRQSRFAGSV